MTHSSEMPGDTMARPKEKVHLWAGIFSIRKKKRKLCIILGTLNSFETSQDKYGLICKGLKEINTLLYYVKVYHFIYLFTNVQIKEIHSP